MTQFFATRSQAAKAAQRAHIAAFKTLRFPSHGWKYEPMKAEVPQAILDYAASVDFVHHVEVNHIDEGRKPGYTFVLVVTCRQDELPLDLSPNFKVEPITPELFSKAPDGPNATRNPHLGTTAAPRERSATGAPSGGARPAIWAHADAQWEAAGKPMAKDAVLAMRKRWMIELEEQGIAKTTSSTALGDWMKNRLG